LTLFNLILIEVARNKEKNDVIFVFLQRYEFSPLVLSMYEEEFYVVFFVGYNKTNIDIGIENK
jgi:hypothetical protein